MLYLVPKNVATRYEFFGGFGWRELLLVLAAGLVGMVLFVVAGVWTGSPARVLLVVVPAGLAFLVAREGRGGGSALALAQERMRFRRAQQRFLYFSGRGDDV